MEESDVQIMCPKYFDDGYFRSCTSKINKIEKHCHSLISLFDCAINSANCGKTTGVEVLRVVPCITISTPHIYKERIFGAFCFVSQIDTMNPLLFLLISIGEYILVISFRNFNFLPQNYGLKIRLRPKLLTLRQWPI